MDSKPEAVPTHKRPDICAYFLSHVASSSVPLRVGVSSIGGAGSGLFAVEKIPEGTDIFTSKPLILCREPSLDIVCDYCFTNKGSNVHVDGRFYTATDKRPVIARCAGCRVTGYCSKACQKKAWKSYHRDECALLKENPNMSSVDLALVRALFMIGKDLISKDGFRALGAMEGHYEERMDRLREKADTDGGVPIDDTLEAAKNAIEATDSQLDLGIVRKLYCALLTNACAIRPAETEASYGTCVDLVVALINHCCDENANIFFEGRELRCRAAKTIEAGEEITACYADERQDVLLRRKQLMEVFFIKCECGRCRVDIAGHVKRGSKLKVLTKDMKDLVALEQKAHRDFSNVTACQTVEFVEKFEKDWKVIVKRAFPNSAWPGDVEPMPTIHRTLGFMFKILGYVNSLEFMLKGTLYHRNATGPTWILDMWEMVRWMIEICYVPDGHEMWKTKKFVKKTELRDVARGYLMTICMDAIIAFGLNTRFARALFKVADNILEYPGDPSPSSQEFSQRFETSQTTLLKWANMNVEDGMGRVQLPCAEDIMQMTEQMAVLVEEDELKDLKSAGIIDTAATGDDLQAGKKTELEEARKNLEAIDASKKKIEAIEALEKEKAKEIAKRYETEDALEAAEAAKADKMTLDMEALELGETTEKAPEKTETEAK